MHNPLSVALSEKMVLLHGIKVVRDSVGPDTDRRTNVYPILISRLLFCFILIGH
ncbi:hypothetical protein HanPI659440_Chr17g0664931 [Helianthus annuus]|nr:hypothetical protein HanPI659440_Chr17g0664931 [Helianthus annuus]